MSEDKETSSENIRWYHRRKMAYRSLHALILIALLLILAIFTGTDTKAIAEISGLLATIIIGLVSVVGLYFGVTGWFDVTTHGK